MLMADVNVNSSSFIFFWSCFFINLLILDIYYYNKLCNYVIVLKNRRVNSIEKADLLKIRPEIFNATAAFFGVWVLVYSTY